MLLLLKLLLIITVLHAQSLFKFLLQPEVLARLIASLIHCPLSISKLSLHIVLVANHVVSEPRLLESDFLLELFEVGLSLAPHTLVLPFHLLHFSTEQVELTSCGTPFYFPAH